MARLNADIHEKPDDNLRSEILYNVRNIARFNEVVQSVKEYRASIKTLKTKTGIVYTQMLATARSKLKTLLAEKAELEAEQ